MVRGDAAEDASLIYGFEHQVDTSFRKAKIRLALLVNLKKSQIKKRQKIASITFLVGFGMTLGYVHISDG